MFVSASQIRAARGLLNWSQDELAEASRISRSTVQNVENGVAVRGSLMKSIWRTLKDHGVEFLQNNGVRQKAEGVRDFMGQESCDLLFDDIAKTVRSNGGNFVCSIYSEPMLTRVTGAGRRSNLQRLEQVQKLIEVKCLIPDEEKWNLPKTSFPVRALTEDAPLIPASYFVYGDRVVFGFFDSMMQCVFVVFENAKFARYGQSYFLPRWNGAKPLSRHFA